MKTLTCFIVGFALAQFQAWAAPLGTAFTYQGRLGDNGVPAHGNYDLRFFLFDVPSGGVAIAGPVTNANVVIADGLFAVTLDFDEGVFDGAARWLQIGVRTNGAGAFTPVLPRQQITPAPYAIFSASAGGVSNGVIQNPTFIGTTGNTPLDLFANSQRALRLVATPNSVNVIGGFGGNNVAVGVEGATIGGGGLGAGVNRVAADFGTVGGGYANISSNTQATVGGGAFNVAAGISTTIGGGFQNSAFQNDSTVAGGYTNTASGLRSTVGGGAFNAANNQYTVVAGGNGNVASGDTSVVSGGALNTASGFFATVGGGYQNFANGLQSTISGGQGNFANNANVTIAGGGQNVAIGLTATISGGFQNQALNTDATIGGGYTNVVTGYRSTIAGGAINTASGQWGVISGGQSNRILADISTVGGGEANAIGNNSHYSTIGGGRFNSLAVDARMATIAGGYSNFVGSGSFLFPGQQITNVSGSFIGGGFGNRAEGSGFSVIGGGANNWIRPPAYYSFIGGGVENTNAGIIGIVAGGSGNFNAGTYATISGGWHNSIDAQTDGGGINGGGYNHIRTNADYSTIGGGYSNRIGSLVGAATIGGGSNNTASGVWSAVGGGADNVAGNFQSVVGGGRFNSAAGISSTVSGGFQNAALNTDSTVSGGYLNVASGYRSTVPGGTENAASADYSFAAGRRAKADDLGSFVWADSRDFDFRSGATNQFAVRCTGGARFVTAIDGTGTQTAGVRLFAGDTAWSAISDRNEKKNFQPLNGVAVLTRLAAIPITQWNYKWESETNAPHIGPMAQDFKAAFYPGRDDKSISTLEFDGVALAAIQGLNQKMEDELKARDARIDALEKELVALKEVIMTFSTTRN
jgi:hypothetical protein